MDRAVLTFMVGGAWTKQQRVLCCNETARVSRTYRFSISSNDEVAAVRGAQGPEGGSHLGGRGAPAAKAATGGTMAAQGGELCTEHHGLVKGLDL